MTHTTLYTGAKMPLLGLGTWQGKEGEVEVAVKTALENGYQHIDCARVYGNEAEIGRALKETVGSVIKREDLFVTSKLWNSMHAKDLVKPMCLKTLADLQLDYLDLYLIHWPMGFEYDGDVLFPKNEDGSIRYSDVHYNETWKAMEQLVTEGLVRHIGLSNFNARQVDDVISHCTIKPAVLQVESHPYLQQHELLAHCQKHGIVMTAYSPLGSPDRPWAKPDEPMLLEDPALVAISKDVGKTVAQVLIRYQVQRGVVVIPKSVTPSRIVANSQVFDFVLSPEHLATIRAFERNHRFCLPKITVAGVEVARDIHHPHFPFSDPY